MERSEPTFVPEWYKGSSSNAAGSYNSSHHNIASLHSAPDEHNSTISSKNRLSLSVSDHDAPCPLPFSDRVSSSFRRSVSSNGSIGREKDLPSRAYGSFGRSHRDRDRDREKDVDYRDRDRPLLIDNGFSNNANPLATNISEKDSLRRSYSLVSGRRADSWLKKPGLDSSNCTNSAGSIGVGITKSTFERDFPSLGAEEKHLGSDLVRSSSPSISTGIHSLPMSASAIIGGDGWTSALAEVSPIAGGNGQVVSSVLNSSPGPTTLSTSTGLNMAETLAQVPGRVRTTPQLSSDSQKIEELHRQQILKLRPVTPSMLKNSGLNLPDKSKMKGVRIAESSSAKLHPLSNLVIHSIVRSDVAKASYPGQFQVLNRERNGFSPTAKDSPYTTNASRAPTGSSGFPPTSIPSSRGPSNSKPKVDGLGGTLIMKSNGEKKVTSHAQKRNDFFNSLRMKTSSSKSTNANDLQSCDTSLSNLEVGEQISVDSTSAKKASLLNSGLQCLAENGNCPSGGGCGIFEELEKLAPDEEEAAFLRSLGWEENAGEEALTREEIESFLSEYKNRKPASKLKL